MIEPERQTGETTKSKVSENQIATLFLDELARDSLGGQFILASSSSDGYPCGIYVTKSDCDWHPPCNWSSAAERCN